MFFRRERPRTPTFQERIQRLRGAGFETQPTGQGSVRVRRGVCVAIVKDVPGQSPGIVRTGIAARDEIAAVTHGGYQMFLVTESGRKMPATAAHLKMLHAFTEDLREGLGIESLYNTALGTTCEDHLYDRVRGRDSGDVHHPWQR